MLARIILMLMCGNSYASIIQGSLTVVGPTITHNGSTTTFAPSGIGLTVPVTSASSMTVKGVTDGSLAATGNVGEVLSASLSSSQVPGASALFVAISTLSLTAGDWNISGVCDLTTGATSAIADTICAITTVNTTSSLNASNGTSRISGTPAVSDAMYLPVGTVMVSIASPTTYYLVGRLSYTVLGGAVWDTDTSIRARRMR